MAERNPPVWMQSGTYQASDDRMITGLLIDRNTNTAGVSGGIEGGIVPPYDQMRVVASGTSMAYTISAGIAFVPSAGTNPPGAYVCYNDGLFSGVLPVELTGNPRIDLIVVKVLDQTLGASESAWHFTIIRGTPAVNPIVPAWSVNEIPVASIRVIPAAQNGGTNKIAQTQVTDLRNFVTGSGGVHLHWGATPIPKQSPGRLYYDVSQKSLFVSDGTTYDPLYTLKELQSYFTAYRPKTASDATLVQMQLPNVWDPTPPKASAPTTSITGIQRADFVTPTGMAKISINSYGRVAVAGERATVSVRILNGATTVANPGAHVSFYSTTMTQSSSTWVVSGLTPNVNLIARMEFSRSGSGSSNKVYFSNNYLMIEPVL